MFDDDDLAMAERHVRQAQAMFAKSSACSTWIRWERTVSALGRRSQTEVLRNHLNFVVTPFAGV
jgi:hypothetical protein